MKTIDHALQVLVGREPTAEELKKFYTIKEICDLPDYDSIWTILLAFGHYEILYREIPEKIAEQATKAIADHRLALADAADAAERYVRAKVVDGLADTVRKASQEALDSTNLLITKDSRRRFLIGASLSFGAAAIAIGVLCWGAVNLATAAAAVKKARAETAAARFADMNDVSKMLACDGAEMQIRSLGQNVYCIPYDEKAKRASGWRIK